MKTFPKVLKWIFGVVAALALLLVISAYLYLRSTIPEYDGELRAPKLSAPVEIIRDSWGMPHIYAKSDWDAYFAQGYCEAQDRLFQMDMMRRVVRGRLAEILGERVVLLDKMFRTLTAVKSMEEFSKDFPAEINAALEAYAAGVNFYLENRDESLPVEFFLLGYEPESWTPGDCLTGRYSMAWGLNFNMGMEMLRAAVIEKLGPELAAEIFIDYPPGYPLTAPTAKDATGLLQIFDRAGRLPGLPACGASNAWVVSGEKSTTGKPILANDMHLAFSSPAVWYEVHIHTPSHNVSGFTLAGMPLVVAGANDHVAWGMTNSMVDDSDFYIEKLDPNNPDQYEFEGEFRKMRIKQETIRVKDQDDVLLKVRLTHHGPVISDLGYAEPMPGASVGVQWDKPGTALSLRWTANEMLSEPMAIYLLNRARNIEEVEQAAAHFKVPGQNWVYGDVQGNIGYTAAMGIPKREGFDGSLPLPGWDGKHEWSGYVPFEEQPKLRNPTEGYIATANNKITDNDYPHYIGHYFATPDRVTRIRQLLEHKPKLGMDDMMSMHADVYMILAEEWVPVIKRELARRTLSEGEQRALGILSDWNFIADPEQVAPTIFHAFLNSFVENTFRKRLGDDLFRQYVGGKHQYNVHNVLRALVKKGESAWFDNPDTPEVETIGEAVARSFHDAVAYLQAEMGDDPDDWVWGDLLTLTIYHPFGRFSKLLGWFFNIGPYRMGGSISTVNPAPYLLADPWQVFAGASQRSILDLSGKSSVRIISTGISGNFMSSHYDDQAVLWHKGAYRHFVLDRESVERDRAHTLKLEPGIRP